MADTEREAFEAWARQAMGLLDSTPLDWELKWVEAAFKSWQARAALASRPAEVDDEGLPPLPSAYRSDWPHTFQELYTAEQYRQGQRDAVAADRARGGEKA